MSDSKENPIVLIKLDGKEYVQGSPTHVAALEARVDAVTAAKDVAVATEKARADKAEAERDLARKDATDAKAAASPDKLDALVAEQLKLRADAARLLPADYKFDGKSTLQIRTDAVATKLGAPAVAGKSPEYIAAAFHLTLPQAPVAGAAQYTGTVPGTKTDSDTVTRTDEEVYSAHDARMRKIYTDSFGKDAN